MSKRVKRSRDEDVVVINLCQGDAAPPLLPVFLPGVASEPGGVGSPFSVDSLTFSGLRVSSEAAVGPVGGLISASADEGSLIKSSGSFGEGVGVSSVSGLLGAAVFGGVVQSSLRVSLVAEGSRCLVLLGTPNTTTAAGVCDVGAVKSCVSSSYLSIQGVNGDRRPVDVDVSIQSVLGTGCVVSSGVVGALMEDRPVASFVEDVCLSKFKGDLVC